MDSNQSSILGVLIGVFLLLLGIIGPSSAFAVEGYIGAEMCRNCHKEEYHRWISTGHANILGNPNDPGFVKIPLPEGYNRADISYIVGGFKWKAIYLDLDGYIVTATPEGPGDNQYNVIRGEWVDFKPGEKLPYSCGNCHVTGYSSNGNQNGLPGIHGQWAFPSVQCEACHGPGSLHVDSKGDVDVDTSRDVCKKCHSTKPFDKIPTTDVFLFPYTEYNQLIESPHRELDCVECHHPHNLTVDDPDGICRDCHEEIWDSFKSSFKGRLGITCTDCHMPPAGIVAAGEPDRFLGDLKSHLFRIDHHAPFPVSYEDKESYGTNPGYLTVDYSCIPCHHIFETREWATGFGSDVHDLRITSNIKVFRLQRILTYIGILAALISLVSGLSLRGIIFETWSRKRILAIHREFAWMTFSIYSFLTIMCLYFHFPWVDPGRLLHEGLFIIHPFVGFGLFLVYTGKVWTVRRLKKGWKIPGLVVGSTLFLLWAIQFLTIFLQKI